MSEQWELLIRIVTALGIGLVVGVEREYKNRPAGMRTHVLVCLGACVAALIEVKLRSEVMTLNAPGVSVVAGVICAAAIVGIGFLGAGTIFTAQRKIVGLTTAASLWCVACLGLAAGLGYYWIAGAGVACVMVTLLMMQRIVHVNTMKKVEIKFVNRSETLSFINEYFASLGIKTLDIDFHVESVEGRSVYTNIYTLHFPASMSYPDIVNHLSEHSNVLSIRTTNT